MKKRTGKILALLLSLTMVAGMVAGCGSDKTDSTTADSTQYTDNNQCRYELVRRHLFLETPPSMQKMRNPILIRTAHTADGHVYVMALEKL